ncbi:MAG TPA: CYTH and CHAD domain-containing protein [Candidatus Dormibacteraeota bacterium]|nr:CYTH and CHAD domain-containing protein [Candidatus Dormibacteraeota bacterium]
MAEERELKLEAPPHFDAPDLSGVEEGISAGDPVENRITTHYWDTPDLRLARWGTSLRHRSGEGWTVKLPPMMGQGVMVREEQAFTGVPSHPPEGALDLLRAYVRTAELKPVASLRTRRRAVSLVDAGGEAQVEVVDDEVSVLDGRRIALRFRQVEVEVKSPTANGLVDSVVSRLREAGAGPVDPVPKNVRAMGPLSQSPPEVHAAAVDRDSSAATLLQATIASAVARLIRNDPLIRLGGDSESVHQGRVATRRLRSDLRTFKPMFDPEWADSLRDELSWLGELLGDVRDADILAERLAGQLRQIARAGGNSRRLSRQLSARRRGARVRLMSGLRSERYVLLLERLVKAAQAPALAEGATQPAIEAMPPLVKRTWDRLASAVKKLDKTPADEQLHAVRIAGKRVRYASEAVAPVIGKPASRLAAGVTELQDTLGDYNDAVVTSAWLRGAVSDMEPSTAFIAGALSEKEEGTARKSKAAWPAVWKRLSRKKMHQWMER